LSIIGLSVINGRTVRTEIPEHPPVSMENRKNLVLRLKGTLQP